MVAYSHFYFVLIGKGIVIVIRKYFLNKRKYSRVMVDFNRYVIGISELLLNWFLRQAHSIRFKLSIMTYIHFSSHLLACSLAQAFPDMVGEDTARHLWDFPMCPWARRFQAKLRSRHYSMMLNDNIHCGRLRAIQSLYNTTSLEII